MKKLTKLIRNNKYLVFMDFEGTQFSHEMIAIGAVVATLDRKGQIKTMKPSFKTLVKAKSKVGKVVTDLTGITDDELKNKGVSFRKAMELFKTYCGRAFKKCTFVTFGNHDLHILNSSISYNLDTPKEIVSQIQKNYFDYLNFISEFIKDTKTHNPLSLVNYCKHFGLDEAGKAHEPDVDAINLANLYNAFLKNKTLVRDDYIQVIAHYQHLPDPIRKTMEKLASGEDVKSGELIDFVDEYLE